MRRKEREASDESVIEKIIMKSDVCRIAMANGNIPYIVTLNFGYKPGLIPRLYFHCASEGKKLEMIKKNSQVCFEMDTDHEIYSGEKGCDWGMRFSSVVGYGNICIVSNIEEKKAGLNSIMAHYGGKDEYSYDEYSYDEKTFAGTTILRLDITEITGKIC